jgi:hypothetical protein
VTVIERLYQGIRDTVRSGYYRNEVAQSHHHGARLSEAAMLPNTHPDQYSTEIEMRP